MVASLGCCTGAAEAPGPSLADALVGSGIAGAVLAPAGLSRHAANRVLARALARALAKPQRSIAGVLRLVGTDASLDGYACIGDPALTPRGVPGSLDRSLQIPAPPDPDAMARRNLALFGAAQDSS